MAGLHGFGAEPTMRSMRIRSMGWPARACAMLYILGGVAPIGPYIWRRQVQGTSCLLQVSRAGVNFFNLIYGGAVLINFLACLWYA